MIILVGHATTPDELEVVTSAAGTVDAYCAFVDSSDAAPPIPENPDAGHVLISTANTTVLATAPTNAAKVRGIKSISIRNRDAAVTNQVTVQIDRNSINTDVVQLKSVALAPGDELRYEDNLGWFVDKASPAAPIGTNFAAAASAAGFAADTYVVGSAIPVLGLGALRVGRSYHWRLVISKTAAGIATPILIVRVGTAGSTADTARLTFTWGAGTAAIDRGEIELDVIVLVTGATAQLRGKANWTTNLTTTGLTNAVKALVVTSAAFDITPANQLIGLSYNGGTSAVHTIEDVRAYTDNL
jgi:hypothetical protein